MKADLSLRDSPHDRRSSINGAFKEARHNPIFQSESIESIAKGTWSVIKGGKTGWAAGYRQYGASKLCGVTTM